MVRYDLAVPQTGETAFPAGILDNVAAGNTVTLTIPLGSPRFRYPIPQD